MLFYLYTKADRTLNFLFVTFFENVSDKIYLYMEVRYVFGFHFFINNIFF